MSQHAVNTLNEDWLRTRTWDMYVGTQLVTTMPQLLFALAVSRAPEPEQRKAVQAMVARPAWRAAPADLKVNVAEFLDGGTKAFAFVTQVKSEDEARDDHGRWTAGGGDRTPKSTNWAPTKILDYRDTRATDFDTGRKIPGSGQTRECDRCGLGHEVHVDVQGDDGNTYTVGSTCANATGPVKSQLTSMMSASKRVDSLKNDLARAADYDDKYKQGAAAVTPHFPGVGDERTTTNKYGVSTTTLTSKDDAVKVTKYPFDSRGEAEQRVKDTWVDAKVKETLGDRPDVDTAKAKSDLAKVQRKLSDLKGGTVTQAKSWDESEHPRGSDGRFGDGDSSGDDEDDSYHMGHRPMNGPPITNLLEEQSDELGGGSMFPDDIYTHPEWYGGGDGEQADRDAARIVRSLRGKDPETPVTIYRTAPKGVTHMRTGDWVGIVPATALQQGMGEKPSQDMPVYKVSVPAKYIRNAGDGNLTEWGYFGPPIAAQVHYAGGKDAPSIKAWVFVTQVKYDTDQPRDDHGRFGSGSGNAQPEPRKSSRSPIDPFLPGIQERMSRFYADPANKVEILDKGAMADANEMVDMATVARSKEAAWREASPMPWTPAQLRTAGGLRWMQESLSKLSGHRYTAVATHNGEPVAAMGFVTRMDDRLAVEGLGSDQSTPGAGTALEVAVAKWGVDNGATGLSSMATNDAVPFHQLIGRVVTGNDNKSTWTRGDMDKIAALTPQASKGIQVPLENDPDEAPLADFWETWRASKTKAIFRTQVKWDPDQPRDDHGRFGSGSGTPSAPRPGMGDIPITPQMLADLKQSTAGPYLTTDGRFTPERQALHDKIISDALAKVSPVEHPKLVMMGGGPAAGKTAMVTSGAVELPDQAVAIDADSMKAQIPEVQQMKDAGDDTWASKSHEESSYLAARLASAAFETSRNAVLDGTGDSSITKLSGKIDAAHAAGHTVEAHYITVDPESAIQRAQERAAKTGRVVPETFIRDTHAGISRVFPGVVDKFDKVELFDNNGEKGSDPTLIASGHGPGTFQVHDQTKYDRFLSYAKPKSE